MAIKYKEILETVKSKPLTSDELAMVSGVEKYIDDQILANFDRYYSHEIFIDKSIFEFYISPITKERIEDIGIERKRLLIKELKNRFKDAGWELDEDSEDCVKLKGKTLR